MVRFDTYNASAHLVRQLESSGVASVTHDGGDNVLVQLHTGEEISIHLIETRIPPYEIRLNLEEGRAASIHSLFIVWSAMFLPEDNELYRPEPWMLALIALYGGKLYAFDVYGKDIRIFPVYFEPANAQHYHVRYGVDINVTSLGVGQVTLTLPVVAGTWLIADFAGSAPPRKRVHSDTKHHHHQHGRRAAVRPPETPWEILGIPRSTKREDIKRAYRKLARSYHPDLNPSPDATHMMQKLNVAYNAILRELGEER
jgi:DnaJ-domain-containing protein 1